MSKSLTELIEELKANIKDTQNEIEDIDLAPNCLNCGCKANKLCEDALIKCNELYNALVKVKEGI